MPKDPTLSYNFSRPNLGTHTSRALIIISSFSIVCSLFLATGLRNNDGWARLGLALIAEGGGSVQLIVMAILLVVYFRQCRRLELSPDSFQIGLCAAPPVITGLVFTGALLLPNRGGC